jgi:hypothetical protein
MYITTFVPHGAGGSRSYVPTPFTHSPVYPGPQRIWDVMYLIRILVKKTNDGNIRCHLGSSSRTTKATRSLHGSGARFCDLQIIELRKCKDGDS